VILPTRRPPPMMLTFRLISSSETQCRHDLVGDDPHQRFDVRSRRRLSIGAGGGMVLVAFEHLRLGGKFTVAALENAVAAQVAILAAEARIVIAESFLDVEQLLR